MGLLGLQELGFACESVLIWMEDVYTTMRVSVFRVSEGREKITPGTRSASLQPGQWDYLTNELGGTWGFGWGICLTTQVKGVKREGLLSPLFKGEVEGYGRFSP